ncbi:MAG: YggS family pyridoxal phosphate-dependent enzyme [Muribaculaceae bacterium]|nr:YggS family pyridoxal phosphate-dependent enzyme [Muribaculaceae bacterium]MDE6360703.1 YggS family pyridoxal phosphate-dependent enzyme [Muribaculaceae bacterium]
MSPLTSIQSRLGSVRQSLPDGVGLVAVSKFHPVEALREAREAGQRLFGESRVQELAAKVEALGAEDYCWHFIGHLQTNKVRQLLRLRPALIESVDSLRLLEEIDREAARQGVVQNVLMQLHVAREETKFGFTPEELLGWFGERGFESLQAVHICGVMGMASNTDDRDRVEADFRAIRDVYDRILAMCPDLRGFSTVSMGMSDDYPLAVSCGSTLVRVGSAIFGPREY